MNSTLLKILEWFKTYKDHLDGIQSTITIIGILVGAVWTYLIFVKKRQRYPRAKLEHRITSWRFPDGRILLSVTLGIQNPGDVLLTLTTGFTRVQQMRPLHHSLKEKLFEPGKIAVAWPRLGKADYNFEQITKELEPSESEELNCEFILPSDIEQIRVYSYLANKKRTGIGWSTSTIYQIPGIEKKGSMNAGDWVRLTSDWGGVPRDSEGVITKVSLQDRTYDIEIRRSPNRVPLRMVLLAVPSHIIVYQGPPEEEPGDA